MDLTKAAIRELSRRAGLPTWDEPASACLSSVSPTTHEVTGEKLRMIERAERAVRAAWISRVPRRVTTTIWPAWRLARTNCRERLNRISPRASSPPFRHWAIGG